jgi:hypothetical protein
MVKELTAEKLNCPLFLHKIARVRYYKAINPIDNELITVSLNVAEKDGHYDVSATVSSGETVFSELSLMFTNG